MSEIVNENALITSPYFGYVMETRLLAGSTLIHLSLKVNQTNFHIHARIPGLNFFHVNEKVRVLTDPSQIFVFKK
jgi:iron(III) transport system ATP-binding protein